MTGRSWRAPPSPDHMPLIQQENQIRRVATVPFWALFGLGQKHGCHGSQKPLSYLRPNHRERKLKCLRTISLGTDNPKMESRSPGTDVAVNTCYFSPMKSWSVKVRYFNFAYKRVSVRAMHHVSP